METYLLLSEIPDYLKNSEFYKILINNIENANINVYNENTNEKILVPLINDFKEIKSKEDFEKFIRMSDAWCLNSYEYSIEEIYIISKNFEDFKSLLNEKIHFNLNHFSMFFEKDFNKININEYYFEINCNLLNDFILEEKIIYFHIKYGILPFLKKYLLENIEKNIKFLFAICTFCGNYEYLKDIHQHLIEKNQNKNMINICSYIFVTYSDNEQCLKFLVENYNIIDLYYKNDDLEIFYAFIGKNKSIKCLKYLNEIENIYKSSILLDHTFIDFDKNVDKDFVKNALLNKWPWGKFIEKYLTNNNEYSLIKELYNEEYPIDLFKCSLILLYIFSKISFTYFFIYFKSDLYNLNLPNYFEEDYLISTLNKYYEMKNEPDKFKVSFINDFHKKITKYRFDRFNYYIQENKDFENFEESIDIYKDYLLTLNPEKIEFLAYIIDNIKFENIYFDELYDEINLKRENSEIIFSENYLKNSTYIKYSFDLVKNFSKNKNNTYLKENFFKFYYHDIEDFKKLKEQYGSSDLFNLENKENLNKLKEQYGLSDFFNYFNLENKENLNKLKEQYGLSDFFNLKSKKKLLFFMFFIYLLHIYLYILFILFILKKIYK